MSQLVTGASVNVEEGFFCPRAEAIEHSLNAVIAAC